MLLNETNKKTEVKAWEQRTRSKHEEEQILNYIRFILENKRKTRFEGGSW